MRRLQIEWSHQLPRCRWSASLVLVAAALSWTACSRPLEDELGETPVDPVEHVPQERHIALEGQPNFRDLGGYETLDGRRVRWGEVYRSGELPHLTDEDVERLSALELSTVFNFLLPEEIERKGPDRLPVGVEEISRPIAGEKAARQTLLVTEAIRNAEFDRIPPEINPEFHRMLMDEGRGEYAELLRAAADPSKRPLVFHCSHGIHRTGTASAILLSALGVPWETIREDYLLSNRYRAGEIELELERIRAAAAETEGVEPDEIDMTNVEAFYVLEASYIDGALEAAVDQYGSMEAYISRGLGLSADEIEALRQQLLE